jgi:ATP synthase protein I
MSAPEPEDLRALGDRLDAAERERAARNAKPPPSPMGMALRFATEIVVALVVGGGLGWLADHFLHTKPVFIIVLALLGGAAGIRNVILAANEMNAEIMNAQSRAQSRKSGD